MLCELCGRKMNPVEAMLSYLNGGWICGECVRKEHGKAVGMEQEGQ